MDLWIRSQDKKKLVKSGYLSLFLSDTTWFIYTDTTTGEPFEIGKYKTEKRAIEVLDEIQKFMQPDFKCDGYETEIERGYYQQIKLHFSEPNIFHKRIYEMPKE